MTGSGAEQDRFGGWFGGGKADQVKDAAQQNLPGGSGAEQDRFGGWFGGGKAGRAADAVQQHLPKTSGAEQDRYGNYLGGGQGEQLKDAVKGAVRDHLPQTSGAEQDRYGNWLGSGQAHEAKEAINRHLPQASGAEQDRYGNWLGNGQAHEAKEAVNRHLPQASGAEQDRYGNWLGRGQPEQIRDAVQSHLPKTSGAEQDRYGGWFGSGQAHEAKEALNRHLPQASGAEQDRYGSHFGNGQAHEAKEALNRHLPRVSGAEQDRYGGWFGGDKLPSARQVRDRFPGGPGAEQDRYGSHFNLGNHGHYLGTTTVGLLQKAVLPSFGLHAGLGAVAYGVARYTNRAEIKDYLWPSGQVANAWWSAIGVPVVYGGVSISAAWAALTYDQKLLLTGVTAWGLRLFYRVVSRSLRRGEDDARYVVAKKQDPGFWNKALFTLFLPEAVAQTLITLPFVLPFRAPISSAVSSLSIGSSAVPHSLAIFLFATGFATEVFADQQLEAHSQKTGNATLNREGVWSIVRHPNYLGDALCHLSFSVLASAAGLLHPLAALGPVVNYVFLRAVGGDKENEASQEERYAKENQAKYQQLQEYKQTKNSFWPSSNEVSNRWLWAVVGIGAGAAVLEQSIVNLWRL